MDGWTFWAYSASDGYPMQGRHWGHLHKQAIPNLDQIDDEEKSQLSRAWARAIRRAATGKLDEFVCLADIMSARLTP